MCIRHRVKLPCRGRDFKAAIGRARSQLLHDIERSLQRKQALAADTRERAQELAAIEAGAQDFEASDEGATLFMTEPTDLDAVCKALPEFGFSVNSAQLGYRSKNPVSLSGTQLEEVEAFLDALNNHDDVQNMYVGLAG